MTEQELTMRMDELIKILDFVKKVTSMRWDNPGVILGLLNGMLDTERDESVMVFSTESLTDFMRNWNSCVRRTVKHYDEKDMLRLTKSILNIYEKDAEPIMHILDSMLEDRNGRPIVQFCANLLNDIRH
ncbi:MAG: hypothetical protein RBT65_12505 [Methanolobus sp.]|nr:hypothetical protein [Methanolobus sp.]